MVSCEGSSARWTTRSRYARYIGKVARVRTSLKLNVRM